MPYGINKLAIRIIPNLKTITLLGQNIGSGPIPGARSLHSVISRRKDQAEMLTRRSLQSITPCNELLARDS